MQGPSPCCLEQLGPKFPTPQYSPPATMGKTITRTMKKEAYDRKFCALLERYDTAFLVHADNVGSKQFQHIRTVSARTTCRRRQTPKPRNHACAGGRPSAERR